MEKTIIHYLQDNHIAYELIEHHPVFTMEHTKEIPGINIEEGAKSLLLKTKNSFILAVLPGHKKLDSKKLKNHLGIKDLRFSTPKEVQEIMHCSIGSCYPLGNLINVPMVLDVSFQKSKMISFTPGIHTKSLKILWKDYEKTVHPLFANIAKDDTFIARAATIKIAPLTKDISVSRLIFQESKKKKTYENPENYQEKSITHIRAVRALFFEKNLAGKNKREAEKTKTKGGIMKKALELTIENKKINLDFNVHFNHLVAMNQSLNKGAYDSYRKRGRTYVDVPEIVGITGACENVDTLFKVGNHSDIPLFFTQTGQLALEQALQSLPSVFTVIHSGRDEEIEDERHLRQFRLTEEEFDATTIGMTRENYDEDKMYEALLVSIQETIQSMMKEILKDNEKVLQTVYKRNIEKIRFAATHNFHRIAYEDAVKLLNDNGYPEVMFGDDLKANHEAKIVELLNKKEKTELPVFIMKYPKEIKFFNMKVSTKDQRVCLSADCIFPYAGEGTGASVREHDFEKLNERLITSTMFKLHIQRGGTYDDFKWYLDIMEKKATNPHAGYGAGNDRIMQFILGTPDIRTASLFYLLNLQTGDWNKKHYGKAPIITPEKKHILLSIGRMENKKHLLPAIKQLAKSGSAIFYATEHTHDFLKNKGIQSALVHKISDVGETPNISELLGKKVFDLIVNIPTRKQFKQTKEFTDGNLIRKGAIKTGIALVTDIEVATMVLENLNNKSVTIPAVNGNGKATHVSSARFTDANVGL